MTFERFMLACVFVAMLMIGGGSAFKLISIDANSNLWAMSESKASQRNTYTVKSGDTLSAIAQSQLGNSDRYIEIASLNGIQDASMIQPGQGIKLP